MGLKKKAPSFEERLNSAKAESAAALSVFDQIVNDLSASVEKKDALVAEIDAETVRLGAVIADLLSLKQETAEAAREAWLKAEAVKALV